MNFSLRAATCAAVVFVALVLVPQAASAALTCSYDGGVHALNVTLDVANDHAAITRHAYGTLLVNGAPCGGATVDNVDGIYIKDVSGARTTVELDATAGSFAPGYTLEGPSSEIETYVDLGAGFDGLVVRGEAYGAGIAVGAQGINLNAGTDAFGGDIDVKLADVDDVSIVGGPADDQMTGQGGAGTGTPYAKRVALRGSGGDDELHGGGDPSRSTRLYGGDGDDVLVTHSSGGELDGGPGNDTIIGGSAVDTAGYYQSPAGVDVDLAITGPQDTGGAGVDTITGVEWLEGTPHDDVLKGTDGPTQMLGYGGDDVLDGRGGTDFLYGYDGADTLRSGSGEDYLDGGPGEDTAAYDDAPAPITLDLGVTDPQETGGSGKESLKDVEDVIGSPFDDHLIGSAAANAIEGRAGADTINGRAGADRLAGGAGIDTIDSRDNSPDSVSCGGAPDNLAVDALDTVTPDCAPPASGGDPAPPGGDTAGGPVPPPAGAPVLTVIVPRQSLRSARAHGLRVLLTCSTACHAGGRLAATRATARRLSLSRRAAKRLGRLAPIDVAAATPTRARVRLTRTARHALRDAHRVALVLRAHAVNDPGRAAAPVRLPVKLRAS